jgi:hypothetical protein
LFRPKDIFKGVFTPQADRIKNETIFALFCPSNFGCLILWLQIGVNNPNPSLKSHSNGAAITILCSVTVPQMRAAEQTKQRPARHKKKASPMDTR